MNFLKHFCAKTHRTDNIGQLIKKIQESIEDMAETRQQLDDQLTNTFALVGQLIAAVQALPQPGSDDFTPEVQAAQNAAAAVQTELNQLNPPPPPGPQKPS